PRGALCTLASPQRRRGWPHHLRHHARISFSNVGCKAAGGYGGDRCTRKAGSGVIRIRKDYDPGRRGSQARSLRMLRNNPRKGVRAARILTTTVKKKSPPRAKEMRKCR